MSAKVILLSLLIATTVACGSGDSVKQSPNANSAPTKASSDTKKDVRPKADDNPASDSSRAAAPADKSAQPSQPDTQIALNDPELPGPHPVRSYSDGLSDSAYSSAIIYYPGDIKAGQLPATTLSGGYTNTKEQIVWIAEHLASHGFIVQVFTPTNAYSGDPAIWQTGHLGSVRKLKAESGRTGSPIAGLVDPAKIGIMGFSMGGAGTLLALNSRQETIKAAIPICAYQPVAVSAPVATLFVTGTADYTASSQNIERAYADSQAQAPKALLKLDQLGHGDITNPGTFKRRLARYLTAWYQVYLADLNAYTPYINGNLLSQDRSSGGIATFEVAGAAR